MAFKRERIREKVFEYMKHLVQDELEADNNVPEEITNFLLKKFEVCSFTGNDVASKSNELDEFLLKLEKFIEYNYRQSSAVTTDFEVSHKTRNFLKAYEKFHAAKVDYFSTMSSITSLLNELIGYKERYSHFLKAKAAADQNNIAVLEKKLEFLKLQSLTKFYMESNAFKAHVMLKQHLIKWKADTESEASIQVQQEKSYDKLHENQEYIRLLKTYKQLIKQHKKLSYVLPCFSSSRN